MDLDFTEEQSMLRETTKAICEQHYSMMDVRNCENTQPGYPLGFWQAVTESGLGGLLIDEDFGGAGMGLQDAVVVFEELGRHLAYSPLLDSCVIAATAIKHFGSLSQQADYLSKIADGSMRVAVANLAPGQGYDCEKQGLDVADSSVSAVRHLVSYAHSATHFLLVGTNGEAQTRAYLIAADAQGLSIDAQANIASLPCAVVTFDKVVIDDSNTLKQVADWNDVAAVGALVAAAMAAGGAERMLDITVDYSKTRVQFDKPIGAFQSLSHYMAELATDIEGSKTLNYHAAWAFNAQRDWALLGAQAKLQSGDCFRKTTAVGTQIHGGLGFTREADAQLYFRRAKFLQMMYWDAEFLERRIADLLLAA